MSNYRTDPQCCIVGKGLIKGLVFLQSEWAGLFFCSLNGQLLAETLT